MASTRQGSLIWIDNLNFQPSVPFDSPSPGGKRGDTALAQQAVGDQSNPRDLEIVKAQVYRANLLAGFRARDSESFLGLKTKRGGYP